ncbi:MAG TPA: hypothetical protein VF581_13910 [Flavobacterium sp.]|jgi:hypothetical protein
MKNLILTLAIGGMLTLTSCKKETVVEQTTTVNPDGSTVTTTKTTTDYDVKRLRKAEADYTAAENDVIVAREKGDTNAERIAREAADRAKTAWEKTKEEVRKGAAKTKEATKEAGQDIKDGYNNALEKAKTE